jgi:hypothetical protein
MGRPLLIRIFSAVIYAPLTFAGIASMMRSMSQKDGCLLGCLDVHPEGYLTVQAGWRQCTARIRAYVVDWRTNRV